MRIGIITRNLSCGGAERVISILSNYLVQNRSEVYIFSLFGDDNFYHLNAPIKLINFKTQKSKIKKYSLLKRKVKELKLDVILAMPEDIGIYSLLFLSKLRIPIVVSERNYPKIFPKKRVTRILRYLLYPKAKGIIFQTNFARDYFGKRYYKNSIVLDNPINYGNFPKINYDVNSKKISAIGRLEYQKGFDILIKSFKRFKNYGFKLHIYGDGSEKENLYQLIKQLDLTDCIFLEGKRENILEEIKDSYFIISSSRYEGMPNAILEAASLGIPVIATDCPAGGTREIIKNNINGVLVQESELENTIERFMTEPEFVKNLANKGDICKVRFDEKNVLPMWEKYLISFIK